MAFTTTQLTALEDAIATGELEVTYDGKTVKYRTTQELIAAYNFVYAKLVAAGMITDQRNRVSVTEFSKD